MRKSNKVVPKKQRGRPATGRDPVTAIRLSDALRKSIDQWVERQTDKPGRSEAIRRLVGARYRANRAEQEEARVLYGRAHLRHR